MVRIGKREISSRLTQERVHNKIKTPNCLITKIYGFKSISCTKEKLFNEILEKVHVSLKKIT